VQFGDFFRCSLHCMLLYFNAPKLLVGRTAALGCFDPSTPIWLEKKRAEQREARAEILGEGFSPVLTI